MNKIIIILVIFVMLFSGFTLLENSQTNNFYENKINTNNFISSNSPIYNLTIYIHNSPAGNGYYQQLFNFNSTSYFINNLNQNASNFYISYENGTLIYSWIQNWNFTTKNLSVWSKLQNGTKVIMIEIFNQNTNLLSATGYLGYSTTFFNAKLVFPHAWSFTNGLPSGWSTYHPQGLSFTSAGMQVIYSGSGILSNITFSPTTGELEFYANPGVQAGTNDINGANVVDGYENYTSTTINQAPPSSTIAWTLSGYGIISPFIVNKTDVIIKGTNTSNHIDVFSLFGMQYTSTAGNFFLNNSFYQSISSPIGQQSIPIFLGEQQNYSTYSEPTYQYAFISSLNNSQMPTFTIELNIYNINIKSFDKQSNPIHNYFFYNNSVYSSLNNTFVFKNKTSFSEISLIPLNFSTYFTNFKNITISQSQFINNNNSYYYNLSIYYYNSNLNTVNPYDFANYIYPISILVFLLLGGIILFGTIKYRRSN